nr:unnamed protein product [Callosobruchus analis]
MRLPALSRISCTRWRT